MSRKAPLLAVLALLALCAPTQVAPLYAQSRDKPAPAFALEVLQGEASGTLEDARGKVVIVEFWATYCGWCKATHPKLAAFADANPESVVVLGISAQKKSRLRRYLKRHDTGFTILHDPRARVSRAYRATATPTLVVIDREGKVHTWGQGGNKLKAILRSASSLLKQ